MIGPLDQLPLRPPGSIWLTSTSQNDRSCLGGGAGERKRGR